MVGVCFVVNKYSPLWSIHTSYMVNDENHHILPTDCGFQCHKSVTPFLRNKIADSCFFFLMQFYFIFQICGFFCFSVLCVFHSIRDTFVVIMFLLLLLLSFNNCNVYLHWHALFLMEVPSSQIIWSSSQGVHNNKY